MEAKREKHHISEIRIPDNLTYRQKRTVLNAFKVIDEIYDRCTESKLFMETMDLIRSQCEVSYPQD